MRVHGCVCPRVRVHARVHEIGHGYGVETRKSSMGFSGRLELGAALVGRIQCVAGVPEVLTGPKSQLRETHGSDPWGQSSLRDRGPSWAASCGQQQMCLHSPSCGFPLPLSGVERGCGDFGRQHSRSHGSPFLGGRSLDLPTFLSTQVSPNSLHRGDVYNRCVGIMFLPVFQGVLVFF